MVKLTKEDYEESREFYEGMLKSGIITKEIFDAFIENMEMDEN